MSVPRLKLRVKLKLFLLKTKQHIWCRWFKWHRRCYPGVMIGMDPNAWHCDRCAPCSLELDIMLNRDNWIDDD
jgi:hypothetical protein